MEINKIEIQDSSGNIYYPKTSSDIVVYKTPQTTLTQKIDNVYTKTVDNDGIIEFNSRDDNISYFLLSISWRVMKLAREKDETTFTNLENEKIDEVIEK